jgi:acyl-CoA thioesterase
MEHTIITSDLPDILGTLRASDSNETEFSEAWTQGRSAYGGLSAALATTAMAKGLENNLPLRSLMVSFIAPIPAGPVAVNVRPQRQGKNVTQLGAEVMAEGNLCLQAMGVFGKAREAIRVAPGDSFDPLPRDQGVPIDKARRLPEFLQYFEGSWAGGGIPFSGRPDRKLYLWARHRCDMGAFPAEKIVAIADIPPPVVLSHFTEPPVPASSLTWSLEFLIPPHEIESDWFYLEFTLEAAAEGYTQQSGRIFTEDGVLCALSRQCMVYFGPTATK